MDIIDMITANCNQTAVYWGSPTADGYGGFTFDDAVEISCRWEDKIGVFTNNRGEQVFSKAEVYVLQDLDENGYLYLGELDDLSSNPDDPMAEDNTYIIKRFDKSPRLGSTTEFIRKAYL